LPVRARAARAGAPTVNGWGLLLPRRPSPLQAAGVGLVLLAVCGRLFPHPPNFTPLGAVGLFAGRSLTGAGAWLTPLAALLLSDAWLGFYHPWVMLGVYAGCLSGVPLGRLLLRGARSRGRLFLAAFAAALAFFVLSNLGVWLAGELYPRTLAGLLRCYLMALPFFSWTLLGNLFYLPLLVLAWELAAARLGGGAVARSEAG